MAASLQWKRHFLDDRELFRLTGGLLSAAEKDASVQLHPPDAGDFVDEKDEALNGADRAWFNERHNLARVKNASLSEASGAVSARRGLSAENVQPVAFAAGDRCKYAHTGPGPVDPTTLLAPPPERAPEGWSKASSGTSLGEAAAELAAALRASLLADLQVGRQPHLHRCSLFDTASASLKRRVLALVAAEARATPQLGRAMGAMVGMAVADSLGSNFEFLDARDTPRQNYLEYPAADGSPGGRVIGPYHRRANAGGPGGRFKLHPGQWTDDTSMGRALFFRYLGPCRGPVSIERYLKTRLVDTFPTPPSDST